jgi:hypothetical protein
MDEGFISDFYPLASYYLVMDNVSTHHMPLLLSSLATDKY